MKRYLKAFLAIAFLCMTFVLGKSDVMAQGEGYVVDVATNQPAGEIKPHIVTTGTKADLEKFKSYVVYISSNSVTREMVVPITITAKGVMQCAYAQEDGTTNSVQMEFFSDVTCQNKLTYSTYYKTVSIPKAGTYYVRFSIPSYVTLTKEYTPVSFVCSLWDGRDKLLKNNIWQFSGLVSASKPIYYKVKATKSGIITFEVESDSSAYVTLCSGSKKGLSEKTWVSTNTKKVVFAVNKGSYYIKVDPNSYQYVRVRSKVTSITDASGSTKKKAKTITIGKTKKGIVVPGDSTSKNDWFKFTLTKKTKINLTVTGNVSSGRIRYQLTSSSVTGSAIGSISTLGHKSLHQLSLTTANYLPKGTYYIRFYKDSKDTCGNYNVKITTRK